MKTLNELKSQRAAALAGLQAGSDAKDAGWIDASDAVPLQECRHCGFMVALRQAPVVADAPTDTQRLDFLIENAAHPKQVNMRYTMWRGVFASARDAIDDAILNTKTGEQA